jgi:hypothetical protein
MVVLPVLGFRGHFTETLLEFHFFLTLYVTRSSSLQSDNCYQDSIPQGTCRLPSQLNSILAFLGLRRN